MNEAQRVAEERMEEALRKRELEGEQWKYALERAEAQLKTLREALRGAIVELRKRHMNNLALTLEEALSTTQPEEG